MECNLNELSDYQRKLDDRICTKHNLDSINTINERILAFMVELGELANETRCFKYWSLQESSKQDVILEEYVDGIHFLISLCNELNLDIIFSFNHQKSDLSMQFIEIFEFAGGLKSDFSENKLTNLFKKYLNLGISLGFDCDEIAEGYLKKNEKNHKRQDNNY